MGQCLLPILINNALPTSHQGSEGSGDGVHPTNLGLPTDEAAVNNTPTLEQYISSKPFSDIVYIDPFNHILHSSTCLQSCSTYPGPFPVTSVYDICTFLSEVYTPICSIDRLKEGQCGIDECIRSCIASDYCYYGYISLLYCPSYTSSSTRQNSDPYSNIVSREILNIYNDTSIASMQCIQAYDRIVHPELYNTTNSMNNMAVILGKFMFHMYILYISLLY